ncbi:type IV pilin protein [Dyella sp. A6]|uniref:type IV pilin protein n=1 Tax=Dyella aluminiiresistens TaxID=3069105 RepID=UPI002E75A742|nr:prepilin-type N-terminal cleavage/methylation domain-containing protein [Dyella sp. A6]
MTRQRGFTLIELMTVIVIIAILSALAVAAYGSYITRSKVRAAESDLSALALNLENELQRQLSYSVHDTKSTAETEQDYPGWKPSQGADFTYTIQSTQTTYELKAHGIDGSLAQCVLTLNNDEAQGAVSGCGAVTSW